MNLQQSIQTNNQILHQIERLQKEIKEREDKVREMQDYLDENRRNACPVNYYEMGEDEGGYQFGLCVDFIYVGSRVLTKYGEAVTVKSWNEDKSLIYFEEEDAKPLETSRISIINMSKEDFELYKKF